RKGGSGNRGGRGRRRSSGPGPGAHRGGRIRVPLRDRSRRPGPRPAVTDQTRRPAVLALVALGAIAGLLSGVFGGGGGVVLVPMLALLLRYSQRVAAGTSVAAILPTAIVGGATYGLTGNVDWAAAAALAVGVIVGAQIGSRLLARIPTGALR